MDDKDIKHGIEKVLIELEKLKEKKTFFSKNALLWVALYLMTLLCVGSFFFGRWTGTYDEKVGWLEQKQIEKLEEK